MFPNCFTIITIAIFTISHHLVVINKQLLCFAHMGITINSYPVSYKMVDTKQPTLIITNDQIEKNKKYVSRKWEITNNL